MFIVLVLGIVDVIVGLNIMNMVLCFLVGSKQNGML